MLDLVLEIEVYIISFYLLVNIWICMSGNVEVAWHSVNFDVPLESTSLLRFQSFHKTCLNGTTPLLWFLDSHSTYDLSMLVNSVFVQFAHDVSLVSAENILDVEGEDVARHLGEFYVHIDVHEIVPMTRIDNQLCVWFHIQVVLHLVDCKTKQDESTDDGDYKIIRMC